MLGRLIPCGGGIPLELVSPRVTIGRSAECDIALPLATVSSKHCKLEFRDGVWHVSDLGSRNGIRVNGQPQRDGKLLPGSVLSIAQLRFQVEYSLPAAVEKAALSRSSALPSPIRSDNTTECSPVDPSRPKPSSRITATFGELLPCGGGAPIPLVPPKVVIGRSSNCDVTLPYSTVSSRHCELEFKEGFWHVRDLGSRNGIRVGSACVLAKYIRPGEVLSIATYRFEVNYVPQGDEMPPDERPFAMSLLESAGLSRFGAPGLPPDIPEESRDDKLRKKWVIE
jgi:pSer/pThr/pTyr-binding forkhead associated (FHA) protein